VEHRLAFDDRLALDAFGDVTQVFRGGAAAAAHHGQAELALERLDTQADEPNLWRMGIMLHWHAALRVEAATLAGRGSMDDLLAARRIVGGNVIANSILDRAAALLDDDHQRFLSTASVFRDADCPYQGARTFILAGGDKASAGKDTLDIHGLSPHRPR
jgi:hypothetical protein